LVFILLFTAVFAPTDAAFDKLPEALTYYLLQEDNMEKLKSILTYHVVPGEFFSGDLFDGMMVPTAFGGNLTVSITDDTIMINNATVTIPNGDASNGVIHVIDSVLVPDGITFPTIVELGATDPMFATLIDAVTAAELVVTLSGPGPFTVFAPTEAGFDKLPAGSVEALTTVEDKSQLLKLLRYHIVPELITVDTIMEGMLTSATTLQGRKLTLSVMDMDGMEPHVMVNGFHVQGTAVAGNGIIQIINDVLTVPDDTAAPTATPTASPTVMVVDEPTMAPVESGALSTTYFVATMFSGLFFAFSLLMN
jgi:transforming growth factor-beta-induced protein